MLRGGRDQIKFIALRFGRLILGMDFKRTADGRYKMSQQRNCEAILKRFRMPDCKAATTPTEKSLVISPRNETVSSLVYLATATRPNLSWTVSILSQRLEKPSNAHMAAAKSIFCYIKETKSLCINFIPTTKNLTAYTDSDWANDTCNRRSTSRFVITLRSARVCWKSPRQSTVALSSCEAEDIALALATNEIIYLRFLYSAMELRQTKPTNFFCDNHCAISLTTER